MSSGAKMFLWFLAGTAAGAAGISYLNRNRMDFSHLRPIGANLLATGINLKDKVLARVEEMKEDFEDMAAEARERVDAEKLAACKSGEDQTQGN